MLESRQIVMEDQIDPRARAGGERRRAALDPHPVLHKHLLHRPRPDELPPGTGGKAKQAGLVRRRCCHQPGDPLPTLAETEATVQKM